MPGKVEMQCKSFYSGTYSTDHWALQPYKLYHPKMSRPRNLPKKYLCCLYAPL